MARPSGRNERWRRATPSARTRRLDARLCATSRAHLFGGMSISTAAPKWQESLESRAHLHSPVHMERAHCGSVMSGERVPSRYYTVSLETHLLERSHARVHAIL